MMNKSLHDMTPNGMLLDVERKILFRIHLLSIIISTLHIFNNISHDSLVILNETNMKLRLGSVKCQSRLCVNDE
jgi:hypothetical protein